MKKNDTPLIETINNMTPEELERLNEDLGKKLLKAFAIRAAITIGVTVAVSLAAKKFLDTDLPLED